MPMQLRAKRRPERVSDNKLRKPIQSPFSELPREVAALSAVAFFVAVGFGLIIPALPIFAKTFGSSNTQIGLIISVFAVVRLISGIPAGKMVERFGERLVLGVGLYMVAITTLLSGLSQSYSQLLLFRTLGGLGSSMFSVSATALLFRVVGDSQRGRAQSLYNGGFLIGGIAGPAFGGALIAISPRSPFFVYSITLTIAATVALFFLHEKRLREQPRDKVVEDLPPISIREALKIKPYLYALLLTFITSWVLFGMRSSILPLFVVEDLGGKPSIVGLSFTLAALAQGLVMVRAGRYSDSHGRRPVIIFGFSVIGSALLLLIFSYNSTVFLISMIVMGFGAAFAASAAAIVGDVIKGKNGRVVAFWQMAGDAGMMVGPLLLGYISDVASYRTAIVLTTVIFAFAILVAVKIPETNSAHLGDSPQPQLREG
jgi:MFS family permease